MKKAELVVCTMPLVVAYDSDSTCVHERKVVEAVETPLVVATIETVQGSEATVVVPTGLTIKRPTLLAPLSVK